MIPGGVVGEPVGLRTNGRVGGYLQSGWDAGREILHVRARSPRGNLGLGRGGIRTSEAKEFKIGVPRYHLPSVFSGVRRTAHMHNLERNIIGVYRRLGPEKDHHQG